MVHFADALSEVALRVGARAAVGHSIGAPRRRPPQSPAEFFETYCDALGLGAPLRRATHDRLARRFGAALESFDVPARVARSSVPFLVVHDRDDREVPWTDGAAIAGARPEALLITTEGLGHRRILRDPAVAAAAVAFLRDHLARCACGRVAGSGAPAIPACERCALEQELYDRSSRWRALAEG